MRWFLPSFLLSVVSLHAEPEFPLSADSKPQSGVPKGTMTKDTYTAKESSVFPGTQREYQIYLPAGHDRTKPAAFMVFQDGVIYQAPVVFDNLIAKKDIPPLVGIFIKPGVVPAVNDNALPRFNRSYEYDSITPTYSQFLIDEFLPAIEAKHGLKLSTDPNHAVISGNSSGGICAFMVAWHRPDRFRRVFTGVGTYVGIHGADQLPVLVRKFEPKPLRVFLQSGTGDNNLYCGDWWMANQMMERSLTWAGYDVNHAWGEGGHNQKHASQIFPDVLRWLWRDWQTNIEVKANPKGESKWKGYEVVGDGEWEEERVKGRLYDVRQINPNAQGELVVVDPDAQKLMKLDVSGILSEVKIGERRPESADWAPDGSLFFAAFNQSDGTHFGMLDRNGSMRIVTKSVAAAVGDLAVTSQGIVYFVDEQSRVVGRLKDNVAEILTDDSLTARKQPVCYRIALSPDQTGLFSTAIFSSSMASFQVLKNSRLGPGQSYFQLEGDRPSAGGLCVDTNGWLYVATALGIQVCDQAGRVNFIIPTPKQPYDVCFGGKDLSELFIACGDTIYKRATKAKGIVSGQQAPIKPPPPKL